MKSSRIEVWRRAFLLVALALGLASFTNLRAQVQYQVTDLGALNGPYGTSVATGLNDLGQVVGYSTVDNDSNNMHGFLWKNGVLTDVGPLSDGLVTPGGINNLGQVLINSENAGFTTTASIWYRGILTPLAGLGGTSSFAGGINDLGQIVGEASTAGGADLLPTLWFFPLPTSRFEATVTTLGANALGGVGSGAGSISDNGHIAGWANLATIDPATGFPIFHAVAWVNGNMTDLGTLGGNSSIAFGVDNADQITGWSETTALDPTYGQPIVHSFIVQNGVMTDLGSTDFSLPLNFLASSINRLGQIVGDIAVQFSTSPYTYQSGGGFVWQNGTITNLARLIPNPPGLLSSAVAINSRGQIAATTSGLTGPIHAVLLTPLPPGVIATPSVAQVPRQPARQLVKTLNQERRMVIKVK